MSKKEKALRLAVSAVCVVGIAVTISDNEVQPHMQGETNVPELRFSAGKSPAQAATQDRVDATALLEPPSIPQSSAPVHDSRADGQTASGPEQFANCESGTSGGYSAVNPETQAYGKYQIMPQHYQPSGICSELGKSPGEQETCAGRIYQEQGSGAWSECGG